MRHTLKVKLSCQGVTDRIHLTSCAPESSFFLHFLLSVCPCANRYFIRDRFVCMTAACILHHFSCPGDIIVAETSLSLLNHIAFVITLYRLFPPSSLSASPAHFAPAPLHQLHADRVVNGVFLLLFCFPQPVICCLCCDACST